MHMHTHTQARMCIESYLAVLYLHSKVAWFTIDLNQPPDQRWNELAVAKVTQVILSFYKLLRTSTYSSDEGHDW